MRMLKRVVANEKARRGFSNSFSEPLVIYHPWGSRPDFSEYMGGVGRLSHPTAWTPLGCFRTGFAPQIDGEFVAPPCGKWTTGRGSVSV